MMLTAGISAKTLVEVVKQIKPSVVGIGLYDPAGAPRTVLQGTGFAIGKGNLIATNFHVVDTTLNLEDNQRRVVFVGHGEHPKVVAANIVATDPAHDVAILKIGMSLPAVRLWDGKYIDDGTEVAFTGFPIGAVLGLYPATSKGLISALTPVVTPSINAKQLSIEMLKRLREPFYVYQMDATAYPGNSGSPVYNVSNGDVVAVINKVFVKKSKEAAITNPSGISYSIPIKYLRRLLATVHE